MPRAISESAKIQIIELKNQGFSNQEIASELNICVSTVQKWAQRYETFGHLNNDYSRCGRPQVNDVIKKEIIVKSIEDPFMSASAIINQLDLDISLWTVNKILRDAGLPTRHAAIKPKLKATARQKRIDFAC